MKLILWMALYLVMTSATGCASNFLMSNCREVKVAGDDSVRWLCDKSWSDYWR